MADARGCGLMQDRAVYTRQALMTAASKLFVANGYRATTTKMIHDTAELSGGALYFHFTSKENLAWEILEEQHRLSRRQAEIISRRGYSAVNTLTHFNAAMGYGILTNPVIHAGVALSTETQIFPDIDLKPWEDWISSVDTYLRQGIKENDVSPKAEIKALSYLIGPTFAGVKLASEIMTNSADLMIRLQAMSQALIPAFAAPGKTQQLLSDAADIFAIYSRALLDGTDPFAEEPSVSSITELNGENP